MDNNSLPPVATSQVPAPTDPVANITPAPITPPLKKHFFVALGIGVVLGLAIITWLLLHSNSSSTQSGDGQTFTIGTDADYQNARTQVFNATVATLSYQGRITEIGDRLTLAYITNSLKNSSFSPLQGSVRLPQDSDVTINFAGNRLVIITNANRFQGKRAGVIQESYLLYNHNLLGEQVVLPPDFSEFLLDLVERSFGQEILPTQTTAQQHATNTAIIRGQLSPGEGVAQIANYLELLRLRSINLSDNWNSELLVNEESVLASAAPSNRKVILQLFHQSVASDQRVLLEYAPYNWLGRSMIGFPNNYSTDDYASISSSLATEESTITVGAVKGRVIHQNITDYNGNPHLAITTYFPFYHYYLALTYDLGSTEIFSEDQLAQFQAGTLPSTLTTGVTNFNDLVDSLVFLDRQ